MGRGIHSQRSLGSQSPLTVTMVWLVKMRFPSRSWPSHQLISQKHSVPSLKMVPARPYQHRSMSRSKFFVSAITFLADQQLPYFPCFCAGRGGEWESGIVVTEVKNSPTSDWTPDASQVTRLGHCDCAPRTRCRPSRHPIKSPPRPHRDVRNAREVSFQGDLQGNGEGVLL